MLSYFPPLPAPKPIDVGGDILTGLAFGQEYQGKGLDQDVKRLALQQATDKQAALQKYGQSLDPNVLAGIDPALAQQIATNRQKAAMEWYDSTKWMVLNKPDNYNAWRQDAVSKFGGQAEAFLPKEYPGKDWFMQQEQILTGLKQQITPYQAGRLAQEIARTGIQRDRASVDARYKGTLAEVALAKADAYIKDKSTSKEKGEALSVYRGIYGGEPGDQVDPDKLASVVQILHPNNKQNPYDLALSVLNRPGNLDPGYQTAKAEGPEAADAYVAKMADMIAKGRIKYAAAMGGTGGARTSSTAAPMVTLEGPDGRRVTMPRSEAVAKGYIK